MLKEQVSLQVEGMTCTNCAMSVRRRLEKEGMQEVDVNFATGEVRFTNVSDKTESDLVQSIEDLGYKVVASTGSEKKNG